MTGPSPAFRIGDTVRVVGPTSNGNGGYEEKEFVIMEEDIQAVKMPVYSPHSDPWYPASSLRLVEPELKIGDWVQVIGDSRRGYPGEHDKFFRITEIDHDEEPELGVGYSTPGTNWYPAKSLRKLTPEEVAIHTDARGYATQKCCKDAEKAARALREVLAPLVDDRLAAIEKRQSTYRDHMYEIESRMDRQAAELTVDTWEQLAAIEKRLAFLEACLKDAMESPLDGEKRRRSRREAERLSILRHIAEDMRFFYDSNQLPTDFRAREAMHLNRLHEIEKQIAEGQ